MLGATPVADQARRGRPPVVVSDSGSETGAASRLHVRPGAVNWAPFSALTSAYNPHQVCYSNVRAVRDEETAGSTGACVQRAITCGLRLRRRRQP
jgi:hypothetical protein